MMVYLLGYGFRINDYYILESLHYSVCHMYQVEALLVWRCLPRGTL